MSENSKKTDDTENNAEESNDHQQVKSDVEPKKEKSIDIKKISITELLSKFIRIHPKSIKVIKYEDNFMEIDFKNDNQIKDQLI